MGTENLKPGAGGRRTSAHLRAGAWFDLMRIPGSLSLRLPRELGFLLELARAVRVLLLLPTRLVGVALLAGLLDDDTISLLKYSRSSLFLLTNSVAVDDWKIEQLKSPFPE